MIRIAVDAMGGDSGPQAVVEGAVQAAGDFDFEIILVGQEDVIKRELNRHKVVGGRISVQHADEVIEMGDVPVKNVIKKKNSSIGVCIDLLKNKQADAFVSAGNTGAVVAASTLFLGLLPGIKRPGIATLFPTLRGLTAVIDVGANLNPTAEQLYQYAIMVDVYARSVLKKKIPSIGLLNVGEEASKGTEDLKMAHRLLRDSKLNFIGNIEGRDIFTGRADCVICDGHVGNVVLKVAESLFSLIIDLMKREIQKNPIAMIGSYLCQPALMAIKKETNYEEVGGAPLLGIDGHVIIAHGASSPYAIRNAIKAAYDFVQCNVNGQIIQHIATMLPPKNNSTPLKENAGHTHAAE
jgi:glycerol-3-phosphate acyltransferase PlsX